MKSALGKQEGLVIRNYQDFFLKPFQLNQETRNKRITLKKYWEAERAKQVRGESQVTRARLVCLLSASRVPRMGESYFSLSIGRIEWANVLFLLRLFGLVQSLASTKSSLDG